MRKILLVVAAVMCMGGAFAQLSMGPKLGLNVSSLTGETLRPNFGPIES